jgi:hypothetical protein
LPQSSPLAVGLALGALLLPQSGRAEPAESSAERAGPFLAASVGGGESGDAAPGLTGGGLGLRGRLEVGYGDGRFGSAALSLGLARSGYTNALPPPEMVLPDADLRVTRVGFGVAGEAHLPLGRVVPLVGAAATVDRVKATARGTLLGIRGDYFEASDVGVTIEARAGLDVRVHSAVLLGLRGGWSWTRADLEGLTDGGEWLGGPWLELRVTFDASGFRMASGAARPR